MFRSVFALALSLFLVVEASAQTAPAATTPKAKAKSAKASARTTRREVKKVTRAVAKAPTAATLNDGWPPLEDAQPAVASAATATDTDWGYGAAATPSRGELDNANVYSAPGMPIHIRTSKVPVPYSVRPPRKTATSQQTTLGN
ncbi:hypothetical protein [Hymenobacter glacialis]|uniref:Uncharacterized protein n=1 Tax=Hymenobacter glacialis TaxID=1908236 RepID=A0A1G1SSZ7_9BACT|nr:hypothetical protein [Hymenobacter glacialis]OGX81744.1 hypothetical protein BEN48_05805 [Hymenobacter glacialis]